MGQIFIESRPTPLPWWDHTYLVYRDDNGTETVIRGGPETDNPFDFGDTVGFVKLSPVWPPL